MKTIMDKTGKYGALAQMCIRERDKAFLSRQAPPVQRWGAQYLRDKQAQKAELAEIGKEVINAEVKFASKAQRRVISMAPKAEPKPAVVRVKNKQARRIQIDPEADGMEIYRHRWRRIKNIIWEMGWNNTFIPSWYKYHGSFQDMRNDKVIARDIVFMKNMIHDIGLRC